MRSSKSSVVFFGTGPVAAKSLQDLVKNFNIETVITKPRPVRHKGSWPVLEAAQALGLKTLTVSNSQEIDDTLSKERLVSQIGILIDFGIIISKATINYFKFGVINSHFSLLPRWRGADPISFALLYGDQQTGVSLMKIVPKMDEGPLLAQKKLAINNMDSGKLTEQLISLSRQMLKEFIPKYLSSQIAPCPQPETSVSYSRKLSKQDGLIDWNKSALEIERQIRAFSQWPKSRTKLANLEVIIFEAAVLSQKGKPGEYKIEGSNLIIFCGQGSLKVLKLQPAGKKIMNTAEFSRGYGQKLRLG